MKALWIVVVLCAPAVAAERKESKESKKASAQVCWANSSKLDPRGWNLGLTLQQLEAEAPQQEQLILNALQITEQARQKQKHYDPSKAVSQQVAREWQWGLADGREQAEADLRKLAGPAYLIYAHAQLRQKQEQLEKENAQLRLTNAKLTKKLTDRSKQYQQLRQRVQTAFGS